MIIFSYDISKNVFWGPNPQIWYLGPRTPPKNEKNNVFNRKRLSNMLQTSPQPQSDDDFSSKYDFFPIFLMTDVDPCVALQYITSMGEKIKPLKITLSFSTDN